MSNRIVELEESIGKIMLKVLPPLRSKKEILQDDFTNLFVHMEELKNIMKGRDTIPRSLAYKLFHLYHEVDKEFSYIIDTEKKNDIQSKLLMTIVSILNDNLFH